MLGFNYKLNAFLFAATILKMVEDERIELSISGCKPDVFPLALIPQYMAPVAGLEPTTYGLTVRRSTS